MSYWSSDHARGKIHRRSPPSNPARDHDRRYMIGERWQSAAYIITVVRPGSNRKRLSGDDHDVEMTYPPAPRKDAQDPDSCESATGSTPPSPSGRERSGR